MSGAVITRAVRRCVSWLTCAGLLFAFAVGVARAQGADKLSVVSSDSRLRCLITKDGIERPTYPTYEAARQLSATVRIRVEFDRPDAAPRVEVYFNSSTDAFADAVKAYVEQYRLPCLVAGGGPLLAMQEFQFVPGDGRKVIYGDLRDGTDSGRFMRCVTGNEGKPDYPISSFRYRATPEGEVLVQLRFFDSTSPPQAKVLFDGGSASLASSVLAHVAGYRIPCLTPADAPLVTNQLFSFINPSTTTLQVLKALDLKSFLASVAELEKQKVRFDFSTMGCPFDVQFRLLQPYAPNVVGEIERSDPNRRELLEWLKTVSLNLPRDAVGKLIGQTTTISIPCVLLDLT